MGKKGRRISRRVDPNVVNYSLSEQQRSTIDQLTGYELLDVTWFLVEVTTRRFIADHQLERGADVAEFRRLLKRVHKPVAEMRSRLNMPSMEPLARGATESIIQIYERYFVGARIEDRFDPEPFVLLELATDAMMAAIANAALSMDQEYSFAPSPGDAWKTWIEMLSGYLVSAGHSCAVRKDTESTGLVSPFVRFVAELTKTLPDVAKQPRRSDVALAQAISLINRDNLFLQIVRRKDGEE